MNSIPELIADLKLGKMIILVDDENRENEGDLILPSDFVTPEAINFMASEAKGLICLSMTEAQVERLNIPLMVRDDLNASPNKTAFTISIEAAEGISTGISAKDRAHTIKVASNPDVGARDVICPGHIFPIRAQEGGVLKRAGHTEASVDMSKLSGLNPSAAICEIMNPDGTMARLPELKEFSKKHDIKIGTIEDLIQYRLENDNLVTKILENKASFKGFDDFKIYAFQNQLNNNVHLAFVKGEVQKDTATMVRVHKQDTMADVFGSSTSYRQNSVEKAMDLLNKEDSAILLYLKNEAPSDILNHFSSQNKRPGVMDQKDYGIGAQILRDLGAGKIKLLSNSKVKKVGLKGYGIEIVDSVLFDADRPSTNQEV